MRVEVSNIGELPETNRMGHTCANLNGELLFIWGGTDEPMNQQQPNEQQGQNNLNHHYHHHHRATQATGTKGSRVQHIWIYDTLTGYWRRRHCSGDCPPQLVSTSSSLIGQHMYIFGGHSPLHDNWLNCLYRLDLDSFEWRDLGSQAHSEPTKPIRSDKCVSWTYRGRLYVFGGYGWAQVEHLPELLDRQKDLQLAADYRWPKYGWNNQLVEYEPSSSTWRWPSYSGKCPSARAAHSGSLMGDTYFLFGGRDSRERLNDLYTLNMVNLTWTQLAVISNPLPIDRLPIGHLLEQNSNNSEQNNHLAHQNSADRLEQLVDPELEDPDMMELVVNDEPEPSSSGYGLKQPEVEDDNDDEERDEDEDDDGFDQLRPSTFSERHSLPKLDIQIDQLNYVSGEDEDEDEDNNKCTNISQESLRLEPMSRTLPIIRSSQQEQNDPNRSNHPLQNDQLPPNQQGDQDMNNLVMAADQIEQQDQVQQVQLAQNHDQDPNSIPVGRSFASFTPISESEILLYGGVSSQDENLSDSWLYHTELNRWTKAELRVKHARLWHTGARTNHNEVIIIGGSCSDRVDEFCSDVLIVSRQPKCLKRLALDQLARSVKMRSIKQVKNLPSVIHKLVKLRKQAMAITMASMNQPR